MSRMRRRNRALLQEGYRPYLIRKILEEDEEMKRIAEELAKLFREDDA